MRSTRRCNSGVLNPRGANLSGPDRQKYRWWDEQQRCDWMRWQPARAAQQGRRQAERRRAEALTLNQSNSTAVAYLLCRLGPPLESPAEKWEAHVKPTLIQIWEQYKSPLRVEEGMKNIHSSSGMGMEGVCRDVSSFILLAPRE